MSGPGEYLPDPTEGITRPEDLPKPKVVLRSRNYKHYPCPDGHRPCWRNSVFTRVLHDACLSAGRSEIWLLAGLVTYISHTHNITALSVRVKIS